MSSRSATVLVIFIVAVLAFCFASVFASMTGPISILPNESESGGILDNLSAITDDTSNDNSYDYQDYNYYSNDDSSDNQVETTTDDSSSNSDSHQSSSDSSSSDSGSDSSSNVETTTDDSTSGSGSSGSGSSNVETTTG